MIGFKSYLHVVPLKQGRDLIISQPDARYSEVEVNGRRLPSQRTAGHRYLLTRLFGSGKSLTKPTSAHACPPNTFTTVLLQPCSRRWAGCAAGKCPIAEVGGDNYRVVLGTRHRKYFHISCVETMVDLVSLHQSRFRLDTGTWGLVLRAWFEHNGRIDLAKIAAYIDAYEKFKEERDHFGTRHINWHLAHMTECTVSRQFASCRFTTY
jgi:hypothetical protein